MVVQDFELSKLQILGQFSKVTNLKRLTLAQKR